MTCSLCRQPLDDRGHCSRHGAAEELGAAEDAASRDTMVGRQIGDWVVRRRIGAGGMGIVYEAWQPTIERRAAIKILRSEAGDTQSASGLIAEARAANAIGHRGIIDIFGFGKLDDLGPYIVMEYLEGTALDAVVHERAPLPPAEVVRILDEILSALAAAHARGVIHRDLKPSNVFLVNDPAGGYYVKVLDFGLAKRSAVPHGTTPQTRTSVVVGTPEYMAPEQAMGKAVGPLTDLYALGIIAFEMLTGKLPFEADSAFGMAMHQVNTLPPPVETFASSVPAPLSQLVAELLEKDPANRPESAQTVRGRLKELSNALQSGSSPPAVSADAQTPRPAAVPSTERIVPAPAKARGRVALYAGIGGALLVLVSLALFLRGGDAPTGAERSPPPDATAEVAVATSETLVQEAPNVAPTAAPAPSEPEQPDTVKAEELDVAPLPLEPPKMPKPKAKPVAAKARIESPVIPLPPVPTPAPEPAGEGKLRIILEGWADLKIDGVSKGRLRPVEMTLPAGRHVIELLNPYKEPYRTEVVIEKDQTRVLEASLQPLGGAP